MPKFMKVVGESMSPTLQNAEVLLILSTANRRWIPKRGEVVAAKTGTLGDQNIVKRVAGLPGEVVEVDLSGKVWVDGKALPESYLKVITNRHVLGGFEWTLAEDEFVLLGDNRADSFDSRRVGVFKRTQLVGRVVAKVWPPSHIGRVR